MSKMASKKRVRRVHTREFKAETVQLVRTGGRTVVQVARELGLADSMVRVWIRQAEVDAGEGPRAGYLSHPRDIVVLSDAAVALARLPLGARR